MSSSRYALTIKTPLQRRHIFVNQPNQIIVDVVDSIRWKNLAKGHTTHSSLGHFDLSKIQAKLFFAGERKNEVRSAKANTSAILVCTSCVRLSHETAIILLSPLMSCIHAMQKILQTAVTNDKPGTVRSVWLETCVYAYASLSTNSCQTVTDFNSGKTSIYRYWNVYASSQQAATAILNCCFTCFFCFFFGRWTYPWVSEENTAKNYTPFENRVIRSFVIQIYIPGINVF